MQKFYDSIDLLILAGELIKRNYPSELLVLGLLTHAAPRVLKVGQCLSEIIINTGCSMVAGCQQAVSFARGLLWDLVHTLTYTIERCPVHQHVDDLSQPVIAESSEDLRKMLVQGGAIVGREVKRLKIKLSDKSTVVPISQATLGASKDLLELGTILKVKSSCDDVGVEMGRGRRRLAINRTSGLKRKPMAEQKELS